MRKFLLAIILLMLSYCLMAEEADTLKINLALLNPQEINLELRVYAPMQRIYVTANFSVEKDSLPEAMYHSIFLTKDARIEYILINDKFVPPIYSSNLVPEHFNPVFPYPDMLKENSNLNCLSFYLPNYEGKINFTLRYSIPIPDWIKETDIRGYVTFSSNQNWYPRNLTGNCKVYARLLSSNYYTMELGTQCTIKEKDGVRTTEGYFIDSPAEQTILKIIKG
ncbi:MAG TPA: hypothetical protein PLE33_08040 [Candidatus Cloacimonas sp.]|nr:hypothetical protein [Candidatus Cloacimonas sp.]HPS61196.1 hypothetical protein [Candidatus Cloacimonas sp.]